MEDNKYWLSIWTLALIGILGLFMSISACQLYDSYAMVQMTDKGIDPIKAHCAVKGSGERNGAMCVLAAQKL